MRYPYNTVQDQQENTYAMDGNNNRIMEWESFSTIGIQVAGGNGIGSSLSLLNNPYYVEVDASDAVYVVDQSNYRIIKGCPSGLQGDLIAGGISGNGLNELKFPTSMDLHPRRFIYCRQQQSSHNKVGNDNASN